MKYPYDDFDFPSKFGEPYFCEELEPRLGADNVFNVYIDSLGSLNNDATVTPEKIAKINEKWSSQITKLEADKLIKEVFGTNILNGLEVCEKQQRCEFDTSHPLFKINQEVRNKIYNLLICKEGTKCIKRPRLFWGKTKIIKENVDVEKTIHSVMDWMKDTLEYDYVHANASRNWSLGKNYTYMTAGETWRLKRGICGELSALLVGILRTLRIPSMLYRTPGHITVVAQDTNSDTPESSFFKIDPSFHTIEHIGDKVAHSKKRPTDSYSLGLTTADDFMDWTVNRRKMVGRENVCEWITGWNPEKDFPGEKISTIDAPPLNDEIFQELVSDKRWRKNYQECLRYIKNRVPKRDENGNLIKKKYLNKTFLVWTFDSSSAPPKIEPEEAFDIEYADAKLPIRFNTFIGKIREKAHNLKREKKWELESKPKTKGIESFVCREPICKKPAIKEEEIFVLEASDYIVDKIMMGEIETWNRKQIDKTAKEFYDTESYHHIKLTKELLDKIAMEVDKFTKLLTDIEIDEDKHSYDAFEEKDWFYS